MPRVVGIDHLVLSVGDFARSQDFYDKLLAFLGFKRKYDYAEMTGWSNGKTLFWIAAADAQGRKHKYRKGDIGFHHYAFELASRDDVDALGAFLDENGMTVLDPPGEYYGRNYYAVYFADPDGMKLEAMICAAKSQSQVRIEVRVQVEAQSIGEAEDTRSAPRLKASPRAIIAARLSACGAQQQGRVRNHHVAAAPFCIVERTVRRLDQAGGRLARLRHARLDADADGYDAARRIRVRHQ
jgi:catechol 2,3-dioxygenase-like lactoylglutathione lyase family enzyme